MYTIIMHDIAMLASAVACFMLSVDTWKRERGLGEDTWQSRTESGKATDNIKLG